MKRYMLFAGSIYYPSGGIDDYITDCDTIGEAIVLREGYEWANIFDTQTQEIHILKDES